MYGAKGFLFATGTLAGICADWVLVDGVDEVVTVLVETAVVLWSRAVAARRRRIIASSILLIMLQLKQYFKLVAVI